MVCYYGFKKRWKALSNWQALLFCGDWFSLATVGMLAYSSLTISAYYAPPKNFTWTYIEDVQYFVFLNVLFVLLLSKWLFTYGGANSKMKRWLQRTFILVMLLEISHGLYHLAKEFTLDKDASI